MGPVEFWSARKTTSLTRILETSLTSAVPSHGAGWVHLCIFTPVLLTVRIYADYLSRRGPVFPGCVENSLLCKSPTASFFCPLCACLSLFCLLILPPLPFCPSHRMTWMTRSAAWYLSVQPPTRPSPCSFSWLRLSRETSLRSLWKQMKKWWVAADMFNALNISKKYVHVMYEWHLFCLVGHRNQT